MIGTERKCYVVEKTADEKICCFFAHGHPEEACQQRLTGAPARRVVEDGFPCSIGSTCFDDSNDPTQMTKK